MRVRHLEYAIAQRQLAAGWQVDDRLADAHQRGASLHMRHQIGVAHFVTRYGPTVRGVQLSFWAFPQDTDKGLSALERDARGCFEFFSDRIGPSRTMWMGWLSYVALAAGMGLARSSLAAWVLFLAMGVVAGLTESPERALVSVTTGGHRGSGFGVYHALTGVAALVGGIALGLVFQRVNGATAFLVSAVGALGLVVLWPFRMRLHRVPPP